MRYIGTNAKFAEIVGIPPIVVAVLTGRFRSRDAANRKAYPMTSTLLDYWCAPYSKRCQERFQRKCLLALQKGVQLEENDCATLP